MYRRMPLPPCPGAACIVGGVAVEAEAGAVVRQRYGIRIGPVQPQDAAPREAPVALLASPQVVHTPVVASHEARRFGPGGQPHRLADELRLVPPPRVLQGV